MENRAALIHDYDPQWAVDFSKIREVLETVLTPSATRVVHIGSTAVEGLAAKPIIDIDIAYDRQASFGSIKKALEDLGYYHNGDQGIPGREVFKRTPTEVTHSVLDTVPHHLYVCTEDNPELKRHLAFRDYLRMNPAARDEYARLKREVAERAGQDKKTYARLKEEMAREFVEKVLRACNI